MSEWQPIETAPKDETIVLLWIPDPDAEYTVGFWNDGWVDFHEMDREDARRMRGEGFIPQMVFMEPTHWMPLPDPPKSE